MKWVKKIIETTNLPLWGLLITIFIAFLFLITINFYTLKTMSAVRAYINGESNYSKGEKDASLSLITYLHSGEVKDWNDFMQNIEIPMGDSLARASLLNGDSKTIAREGFLKGNNHPDDIEDMIWLFDNFRNIKLMSDPISIWAKTDSLIYQKYLIAIQIKSALQSGSVEEEKQFFLNQLSDNGRKLTLLEKEFSESLGMAARVIRNYLLYVNILISLLILSSVTIYILAIVKRLKSQNAELLSANIELDRLAYSVSHDLRAPINSMLGLVNVAKIENDFSKYKGYLDLIQKTLNKQERFIREMITVSKENRYELKKGIIELDYLIEQVINQHKHMPAAKDIEFDMNIGVHRIFSDSHRLEIILNNLVSNAIKYHDPEKPNKKIKIRTSSQNDKVRVEVEDNGIGIDKRDKSKIFEMYYMSRNGDKSSGLGLFIVKEAVAKLQGKVEVESVKGEGSTFSVILNK